MILWDSFNLDSYIFGAISTVILNRNLNSFYSQLFPLYITKTSYTGTLTRGSGEVSEH